MSHKIRFYRWRYGFITAVFFLIVLALFVRMVNLTLWQKSFLQKQGESRSKRIISIPGLRGMIQDRNNFPLAISSPVDSLWINPQEFPLTHENTAILAQKIGISSEEIYKHVKLYKKKSFVYIKRELNPSIAQAVATLNIPGVYLQQEYKRFYPDGEVTSQLVGYTNIDGNGQEGMELTYNQWLAGQEGKQLVVEDLKGNVVSVLQQISEQKPGNNLTLSIDRRIQFLAYQALKEAVVHYQAKSGSAVVLDIETGEVLAMVNQPSFNPNDRSTYSEGYRNRAVTDTFEPGSTMKAFSIMSALDSNQYTPDTVIETAPGWYKVGRNWVRDELNYKELTVTGVLQKSSNVGVTKMTLSLPGDQFWGMLQRVGFGEPTSSGFPGEQGGYLIHQSPWNPFALATLAFGYGISVTTLQLAQAYSVIGNHGTKVPITLLKGGQKSNEKSEQVISSKVADEMLTMLEAVIGGDEGTGGQARVQGYRVAGKTGTARIAGPGGYYKHRYRGSFVGIAPASHPKLVVAVVVIDPQGSAYYGGLIAAPAFSKIMGGALRILDVPPDRVT
ncbi:MAG: penicillin-binding protein 2 [Gammaproteobacteria bacterium]|nr:penicillin-binding protein 2 [Gammaproteobacteria bacterium]